MKFSVIKNALKAPKVTEVVVNGVKMVTSPKWYLNACAIGVMAMGAVEATIMMDSLTGGTLTDRIADAMERIGSRKKSSKISFVKNQVSKAAQKRLDMAPVMTMADLEKSDCVKVGAVGVSAYVKAMQDQGLVVEETKALTPEEAKEAGLPVDDINW